MKQLSNAQEIAADIFELLNEKRAVPSVGLGALTAALVTSLIYHGADKALAMSSFENAWDTIFADADQIRRCRNTQ